jgi:hypothetical protein
MNVNKVKLIVPILILYLTWSEMALAWSEGLGAGYGRWDEVITIDKYMVDHQCTHSRYYINKTYSIKLTSKYKMFKNYHKYSENRYFSDGVKISTDLYEIEPTRVIFHNREKVELFLGEEDFKNIVQSGKYVVFFPKEVFGEDYRQELWARHIKVYYYDSQSDHLRFYSLLSSEGLSSTVRECNDLIAREESIQEKKRIESEKPINRLKNFFGLDE